MAATNEKAAETYKKRMEKLDSLVSAAAKEGTPTSLEGVGPLLARLTESRQASGVVTRIRSAVDRPNLHLQINKEVLAAAVDRKVDRVAAVNDVVLERARRSLPPGHWNIGMFLMYRGRTLADLDRFAESVEVLLESKAILDAALGPEHPRSVEGRRNLEDVHRRWDVFEPGAGHGAEADRWLATLPPYSKQ